MAENPKCRADAHLGESPASWALMVLIGVGAFGSWAGRIYILNAPDSAMYHTGHGRDELELWAVLIGLLIGYALASSLVMMYWLRGVGPLFRPKVPWAWVRWVLWFVAIVVIGGAIQPVLGGFFVNASRHSRPHGHQTTIITIFVMVCAIPGLIGILAIRALAVHDDQWADESPQCLIAMVNRLRRELGRFLGVFGLLLTLTVVTTAARRRALLAVDPSTVFPPEFVILYGLVLVGVLALIHVAASTAIDNRCEQLLKKFARLPSPDAPDLDAKLQLRRNIEILLGVGAGWQQRFQNGVIVLAPLLTALIGAAVPGK